MQFFSARPRASTTLLTYLGVAVVVIMARETKPGSGKWTETDSRKIEIVSKGIAHSPIAHMRPLQIGSGLLPQLQVLGTVTLHVLPNLPCPLPEVPFAPLLHSQSWEKSIRHPASIQPLLPAPVNPVAKSLAETRLDALLVEDQRRVERFVAEVRQGKLLLSVCGSALSRLMASTRVLGVQVDKVEMDDAQRLAVHISAYYDVPWMHIDVVKPGCQ